MKPGELILLPNSNPKIIEILSLGWKGFGECKVPGLDAADQFSLPLHSVYRAAEGFAAGKQVLVITGNGQNASITPDPDPANDLTEYTPAGLTEPVPITRRALALLKEHGLRTE